jgi:hypothetical protein
VLEPSAQSAEREFAPKGPTDLSGAAAASIRAVIDDAYGRYLTRHGKRRWCDKSLDSIPAAELLADLYPRAQFVCLYRHCLDVIVSVVEACPWGLNGYGFDPYAAASAGNSVAAVARCWLDQIGLIMAFQQKYPGRCHGIRYEDLVTEPEQVTSSLFDFLGVDRVPGITTECFAAGHDIRGRGDHKIWFTARVNRDSLGQGSRVPVQLIPAEMLARVNQTLGQLEYRQIDDRWPAGPGPLDPRAGHEPHTGDPAGPAHPDAETERAAAALAARLTNVVGASATGLVASWPAHTLLPLTLVVSPARGSSGAALACVLGRDGDGLAIRKATVPDPAGGILTAIGATWLAILNGQANIATEELAGRLRFTDASAASAAPPPTLPAALRLLAQLLGLTANRPSEELARTAPAGLALATR